MKCLLMTRRIRQELRKFFDEKELTDKEREFILGCMTAQKSYPQLTKKQWDIVQEIKLRYKEEENG